MQSVCARIIIVIAVISFAACKRTPFVNHKLKLEAKGDCSKAEATFKLVSNIAGERYEFDKCLPADYDREQLVTERRGDTVLVRFMHVPGESNTAYHVTLDIDSYPRYSFITIDEDTYTITPTIR